MSYETASAIRFDLYECKFRPADLIKPHWPQNSVREAWIPQTLGEQVWVLFDFATQADRAAWERTLPKAVSRFLDRQLIPHAVEHYGWVVRDPNGFPVRPANP
jgi:hypothetical protein